jgi:hypothetical protein
MGDYPNVWSLSGSRASHGTLFHGCRLSASIRAMTKPAAFKQADLARACKALGAAGLPVVRVRVLPGGIIDIITAGNDPGPDEKRNPLDRLHAA